MATLTKSATSAASAHKQAMLADEVWEGGSTEADSDIGSDCGGLSPCSTADSATPPDSQSIMALVSQLREENARLHEALAESSHEIQRLSKEKSRESMHGVDYEHILALARELNDDFDGHAEASSDKVTAVGVEPEVFAMDSPRGEPLREQHCEDSDSEVAKLRSELADSRADLSDVRKEYEARDAELRRKFQTLMAAVSSSIAGGFAAEDDSDAEHD